MKIRIVQPPLQSRSNHNESNSSVFPFLHFSLKSICCDSASGSSDGRLDVCFSIFEIRKHTEILVVNEFCTVVYDNDLVLIGFEVCFAFSFRFFNPHNLVNSTRSPLHTSSSIGYQRLQVYNYIFVYNRLSNFPLIRTRSVNVLKFLIL